MATWDVFHSDRLEVVRALSTDDVRQALARGEVRDDDLIRPAGTTVPWARIADFPDLIGPGPEPGPESPPEPAPEPAPAPAETEDLAPPVFAEDGEEDDIGAEEPESFDALIVDDDEDEDEGEESVHELILVDDEEDASPTAGDEGLGRDDFRLDDAESRLALPIAGTAWDAGPEGDEYDPQDEDEEAAEFTLSRGGPETVEELDLAAMVDVAFQLVLFFLVTATTVLYKSLEVPKPNPESPAAAAQQGRSRTMDDLKNDYILVEIDPSGAMKIDHESIAAEMNTVVERLRSLREASHRQAMLLSADFATPHKSAVLAYDAANEIGLGIAIARPSSEGQAAAPAPPATVKAAGPG